MTETSRFFDLANYTEADFALVLSRLRRDGILVQYGGNLVATIGAGQISMASGEAFVQGFWYQNDTPINFAIASNPSSTARTDVLVLRLNRNANVITAAIVQGVVGSGIPPLTQSGGSTWEFPLAYINSANGVIASVQNLNTFSQAATDKRELATGVVSVKLTDFTQSVTYYGGGGWLGQTWGTVIGSQRFTCTGRELYIELHVEMVMWVVAGANGAGQLGARIYIDTAPSTYITVPITFGSFGTTAPSGNMMVSAHVVLDALPVGAHNFQLQMYTQYDLTAIYLRPSTAPELMRWQAVAVYA